MPYRVIPIALLGAACLLVGHGAWSDSDGTMPHRSWSRLLRSETIPPPPWIRRATGKSERPWRGFAPPKDWPAEPASPPEASIDGERFAVALGTLCSRLDEGQTRSYAGWILDHSRQYGVDPFLVSAVIYQRSRCRADYNKRCSAKRRRKPRKQQQQQQKKRKRCWPGVGLGQINAEVHAKEIFDGRYRYWTLSAGKDRWENQQLDVSRFPLTREELLKPEASIYFVAALLSVYTKQGPSLDAAIRSEPHRHPVSHLFWGDRVLGTRFEDLVLTSRRRLLRYYGGSVPPPIAQYRGVPLYSPLDGAPRKVSSGYYDRRDKRRRHRGMDFYSTHGEPVRAIADGVVFFAGIDTPRRGATLISPARSGSVSRKRMGRGGLFVLIQHPNSFSSGYFHLKRFTVGRGEKVSGGDLIGYVGRTGIKESPSHLHFEMRYKRGRFNPFGHLRPYLLPPTRGNETSKDKPKRPDRKKKRRRRRRKPKKVARR